MGTNDTNDTKEQVEKIMGQIRSALKADGGDIELVEVKDGIVRIQLKGACAGCPLSQITLKGFVEDTLKRKVLGIERVEAV